MQLLRTLWRRLFPIRERIVIVTRWEDLKLPDTLDAHGNALPPDDLLLDLTTAYKTCAPVFGWLAREIARKEKLYHQLPPHGTAEDHARWSRTQESLNAQLYILHQVMLLPVLAQRRLVILAKMAEQKKISEAERKALEDFFAE